MPERIPNPNPFEVGGKRMLSPDALATLMGWADTYPMPPQQLRTDSKVGGDNYSQQEVRVVPEEPNIPILTIQRWQVDKDDTINIAFTEAGDTPKGVIYTYTYKFDTTGRTPMDPLAEMNHAKYDKLPESIADKVIQIARNNNIPTVEQSTVQTRGPTVFDIAEAVIKYYGSIPNHVELSS